MNLNVLNKICFALSVMSIVAGVALALVMVWTPGIDENLWKLVATVGIVFLGSFATLSVSRTYGQPPRSGDNDAGSVIE